QVLRNGLAGLIVPCDEVQGFTLPAPVLHNLRWQFHEVPRYVRAALASHFGLAQPAMQQVSELVKDGLYFTMGQKSWRLANWRGQVPTDRPGMRLDIGRIVDT